MPQKSKLSLCLIYNGYYNSAEDVAEHFHDDTELIFIRHGSCSIGIPGEKTLFCHAGTVCVVPAGLRHNQRKGTADLYTDYLVFSGVSSLNSFQLIDASHDIVVAHWFADIHQLSQENEAEAVQLLTNMLVSRLQSLQQSTLGLARYPPTLLKAVAFIEQNYSAMLTVPEIIRNASTCHTGLALLFNYFFQMSIARYLTEVRMYHARQLLSTNPYCNVSEVAHQAGYPDADYFCRKFKRLHGMTPLEYRKFPTHYISRHDNMKHLFRPLFVQQS